MTHSSPGSQRVASPSRVGRTLAPVDVDAGRGQRRGDHPVTVDTVAREPARQLLFAIGDGEGASPVLGRLDLERAGRREPRSSPGRATRTRGARSNTSPSPRLDSSSCFSRLVSGRSPGELAASTPAPRDPAARGRGERPRRLRSRGRPVDLALAPRHRARLGDRPSAGRSRRGRRLVRASSHAAGQGRALNPGWLGHQHPVRRALLGRGQGGDRTGLRTDRYAVIHLQPADRASMQATDVAEGLASTLVMLGHRIPDRISGSPATSPTTSLASTPLQASSNQACGPT